MAALALWATGPVALAAEAEGAETWPLGEALEVAENHCLTEATLIPSVELWLGREAVDRRIRIFVDAEKSRQVRFIVERDEEAIAERVFTKTKVPCADLRAAVALAIALAIDATALETLEAPEPMPPAAEVPEALPPPLVAPEAATPPPEEEPTSPDLRLSVHGLGALGVLPAPTWGGSLELAFLPISSLSLRISMWTVTERSFALGEGTAHVSMLAGQLTGCAERGALRACFGCANGRWASRGQGYSVNHATSLPWFAIAGGVEGALEMADGFRGTAQITAYLPLMSPALQVRDENDRPVASRQAPGAGVVLRLGVEMDWP